MYSIILVEDDSMQREILKKMLLSTFDFLKIYEADSESSALDIIENNEVNMFIVDITLKESSGLELAAKIRNIPRYEFKQIIFITTHVDYITQAFKKIHCYDYILKPYNTEEVQAMLNKLILNDVNNLNNKNDISNEDKEIVITLKNGIYLGIKLNDILFIEVKGKNCEVNMINGIMYMVNNMRLKKLLQLIDCKYIIQSHRSFLVNVNYINSMEKLDSKLSIINFNNSSKTALLGYKFKDEVIAEFGKGKVIVC